MLALTWGGRVLSDRLLTNSVRSTREERLKVLKSIVNPSTTVYSCGSDAVSEALWSVFDVVSVLIWLFLQPACWPKSKEIKPCLIHAHCSEMFHYVERNKKNCTCYPELKAQVNDSLLHQKHRVACWRSLSLSSCCSRPADNNIALPCHSQRTSVSPRMQRWCNDTFPGPSLCRVNWLCRLLTLQPWQTEQAASQAAYRLAISTLVCAII